MVQTTPSLNLKSFYNNFKDSAHAPPENYLTKFTNHLSDYMRAKQPMSDNKCFYPKLRVCLKHSFENYWKRLLSIDISLSSNKCLGPQLPSISGRACSFKISKVTLKLRIFTIKNTPFWHKSKSLTTFLYVPYFKKN